MLEELYTRLDTPKKGVETDYGIQKQIDRILLLEEEDDDGEEDNKPKGSGFFTPSGEEIILDDPTIVHPGNGYDETDPDDPFGWNK